MDVYPACFGVGTMPYCSLNRHYQAVSFGRHISLTNLFHHTIELFSTSNRHKSIPPVYKMKGLTISHERNEHYNQQIWAALREMVHEIKGKQLQSIIKNPSSGWTHFKLAGEAFKDYKLYYSTNKNAHPGQAIVYTIFIRERLVKQNGQAVTVANFKDGTPHFTQTEEILDFQEIKPLLNDKKAKHPQEQWFSISHQKIPYPGHPPIPRAGLSSRYSGFPDDKLPVQVGKFMNSLARGLKVNISQ